MAKSGSFYDPTNSPSVHSTKTDIQASVPFMIQTPIQHCMCLPAIHRKLAATERRGCCWIMTKNARAVFRKNLPKKHQQCRNLHRALDRPQRRLVRRPYPKQQHHHHRHHRLFKSAIFQRRFHRPPNRPAPCPATCLLDQTQSHNGRWDC